MQLNKSNYDIIIIGGGAAGLMSAALASQYNKNIAILERNNRVGKKLLITGNGRCNITNINSYADGYYGDKNFALSVIEKMSPAKTLKLFENMGLYCTVDNEGRVYPASYQASSVLDILRIECEKNGVDILCEHTVDNIKTEKTQFKIICGEKIISAKKIIITTGGKAAPNTGSDGSMFSILKNMRYKIITPVPSLVAIKTDTNIIKPLKGIRVKCKVSLLSGGNTIKEECGEVQFNDNNISGIVIMQMSALLRNIKGKSEISLNLMDNYTLDDIIKILLAKRNNWAELTCENLLTGMINKKLGQQIVKKAGIEKLSKQISQITDNQIKCIANLLHDFRLPVNGLEGWDKAQVTAGGIDTNQFDAATMQSKLHKNLYAAGEILNIDGMCGGYNLQFAWSSAYLAAKSVIKDL